MTNARTCEGAWQTWKAREARYRDSSMTDLRQAFEAGWQASVDALSIEAAAAEQYGEQLEAVGEELDRWKAEVRLVGKNREHAERLHDILEGERS